MRRRRQAPPEQSPKWEPTSDQVALIDVLTTQTAADALVWRKSPDPNAALDRFAEQGDYRFAYIGGALVVASGDVSQRIRWHKALGRLGDAIWTQEDRLSAAVTRGAVEALTAPAATGE